MKVMAIPFDALIDHVLTDHEEELRDRFKAVIRSAGDLGEKVVLEELAEHYAHEVGYPVSDEPDCSLVDCELCYENGNY